MVRMSPHPAYTKPTLPSVSIRNRLHGAIGADVDKAVDRVYKLAVLPEPPLHFALGQDALATMKAKLAKTAAEFDEYASWSEGLEPEQ